MGRGLHAASVAIIATARKILEDIHPATVRAVCYQLFTRGLIENMGKGCTDKVSRLLTGAREREEIPWQWIVDETRRVEQAPSWNDPASLLDAAVRQYRKDYWQGQQYHVEVLSEKGTVRGTLEPVLDMYGVPFRVMHGFGSATALNDLAEMSQSMDKPVVLLYVGDFDPSGMFMSEMDLPERLCRYGATNDLRIVRVALTEDDVAGDLPSFAADSKSKDGRFQWYVRKYGSRCWELDAMNPVVLRDSVERAIQDHLDLDAWNHMIDIEAVERESLATVMSAWSNSISRQA